MTITTAQEYSCFSSRRCFFSISSSFSASCWRSSTRGISSQVSVKCPASTLRPSLVNGITAEVDFDARNARCIPFLLSQTQASAQSHSVDFRRIGCAKPFEGPVIDPASKREARFLDGEANVVSYYLFRQ